MADCVIVGAGVVGLLSASVLATAGAEVVVLERGSLADAAPMVPASLLSLRYPWRVPEPLVELALWSERNYPEFLDSLGRYTGIDPEWVQSGLLVLDPADVDTAMDWSERLQIEADCLHGSTIGRCSPGIDVRSETAIFLADVVRVNRAALQQGLRQALLKQGVEIREQTRVCGLLRRSQGIGGAVTAQGIVAAELVVLACGVSSRELLKVLRTPLDLGARQVRALLMSGDSASCGPAMVQDDCCVMPLGSGEVLVTGEDRVAETPLDAALHMMPSLAGFRLRSHWRLQLATTTSGLPCVGEHPELPGLFLNCGHDGDGLLLGLGAAHLLLDMITGQPPLLDPAPFLPDSSGIYPRHAGFRF